MERRLNITSMEDKKTAMKIPVKKSDGTTVFLTMDEFKEYKKNSTLPKKLEAGKVETLSVPAPVAPPPESILPMLASEETELATTTPVTNIFVDEAAAAAPLMPDMPAPEPVMPASAPNIPAPKVQAEAEWKSDDHASLLESDVAEETQSLPSPTVNPATDNASTILAKVKEQFSPPIAKDLEGRFDSLVLSRIRDVRSVIDFEQYAKKSVAEGGLALEEDQVSLLLAIIAAAQKIAAPATKPAFNSKTESTPAPVNPTPAPVHEGIRITPVMSPLPAKPKTPFPLPKEEYSFSPPPKVQNNKVSMQDVTPAPRKQTMGPVDEIQYFSLTDFRRLSPKTDNAKEILKGKFQSLQEESYVLFLDARDAWHESPLFRLYQETVLNILENKNTLADGLAQKNDGLSDPEFNAILEINHYLG